MILIIEGMDRCGKSTLINSLRKNYLTSPKTIVHHSSAPPNIATDKNDWEFEHYDYLFDLAVRQQDEHWDVVFDRFHLGAVVYGQKYRGADPKAIFSMDNFYMSLDDVDIVTILLTDTPEGIASRDDGESIEQSLEEFAETKERFIDTFNKSACLNKLHIDITDNGGIDKTYATVTKYLNTIERRL